jgi:hypothetical protein
MKKPVPPLKDMPEEIESDNSSLSGGSLKMLSNLERNLSLLKKEYDAIDRKIF